MNPNEPQQPQVPNLPPQQPVQDPYVQPQQQSVQPPVALAANDVHQSAAQYTPQPQPVVQQPMQPLPPQPNYDETAGAPQKSPAKKFILIGAIIAGVAAIGVGAWLLISFMSGVPLKTYENDNYSILVPENYTEEVSGDAVSFITPDTEDSESSSVVVAPLPTSLIGGSEAYLKMIDEQSDADTETSDSGIDVRDITRSSENHDGHEARKVSASVYKDDKLTGRTVSLIIIVDESNAYLVTVSSHESHPELSRSTDKILNSFKLK